MKYKINNINKCIEYNGKNHNVPRKEYLLFCYFESNPNRILTREEILTNVWEYEMIFGTRTVDVHIKKLRQRFPGIPIVTRPGYGYMWEVENTSSKSA